jgi:hypothetical protein
LCLEVVALVDALNGILKEGVDPEQAEAQVSAFIAGEVERLKLEVF